MSLRVMLYGIGEHEIIFSVHVNRNGGSRRQWNDKIINTKGKMQAMWRTFN